MFVCGPLLTCRHSLHPPIDENHKIIVAQDKKTKGKEKPRFLRAPKGMHDVLPSEQPYWERIEKVAYDLAEFYGFGRIETPILEFVDLFKRTAGEETDLVQKEMFVLHTKGRSDLALRPEGTAPIARAYLEHNLGRITQPQKLFYLGPMFRHESPQLGRYRQFTQVGFEIMGGPNDPIYDAQTILLFERLLEALRIKSIVLKINSIGCRVCRPLYKRQLQIYYRNHQRELCPDCERRLKTNPLRLLDCKNESCQKLKERAPNFFDKLCTICSRHLKAVLEYLDELQISYSLSNELVRGLDYYNRTVFEFYVEGPGAGIGALPGGGRYDYLMEMLGGRLTPAVGGAVSFERLIAVMKLQEVKLPAKNGKKVFVAHVGELAKKKSIKLIEELRASGISVHEALAKESLKAQLKTADRERIILALIFGQKEIYEENIIIRDLRTGLQEAVSLTKLVPEIKKRLKQDSAHIVHNHE